MIRKFLSDKRGNYAMMTAVAVVPILGGMALAVDYSVMANQRQQTLNALDAAGIATARRIVEGATDDQAKAYAKSFFEANLGSVSPSNTTLTVVLPNANTGGGTLKLSAALKYKPYFYPAFAKLIGKGSQSTDVNFSATSEIRLKNTLEVVLVLDNSGSMDEKGTGSGKKRIDLLKDGAKELVESVAATASLMKQINKPVQFALVPFAASVNVGSDKKTATWMDLDGVSPVSHENFDWTTMPASKQVQLVSGIYYKKGTGWGTQENQKVTRFTLYDDVQRITSVTKVAGKDVYTYAPYASWQGCVEARPDPYNINDAPASPATPATMFVPMFGPDEAGDKWAISGTTLNDYDASNNWWNDITENTSSSAGSIRQKYMPKYFTAAPNGTAAAAASSGPNMSCTTKAITELTDVSTAAGVTAIKNSINDMVPNGATNVPEGLAWGWRALSHGAPFTGGRPETEKGNDKVMIVLTDGANTYYTPSSLGYADPGGNKSTYSAHGYAGKTTPGYTTSRIFQGTPAGFDKTDYSNSNYTKAQNAKFDTLCTNAKNAGVMIFTISLDLNSSDTVDKAQMDALKKCSSDSRFTKQADKVTPAKLYYAATGGSLADVLKAIAAELSNLRIVG